MSRRFGFFLIILVPLTVALAIIVINSPGNAQQSMSLSPEDYAIGSKRFAAASANVTPSLKAAFAEKKLTWKSPIFIRAFKDERTLELWVKKDDKFILFRTYHIAGTSGKLGPKERQGDGQIPEGFYFVPPSQMNPQSQFHLSFNIGYPNRYDLAHDRTGTFIMVHGSNVSVGCLAMTNAKIEEIYTLADAAFKGGQEFFRIHIFPFQMTDEKMQASAGNSWTPFWENLKVGYQKFEDNKLPPNVTVKEKRYHFE